MRIFLLPISTRQALIYCQKITQKPAADQSYASRITRKAAEMWAKWEQAEKGWQKQVVTYGNRGLQRIPYQEWGLKSFPPSNPKLQAEQVTENKKFDVFYPANVMHSGDVPKVMSRLARERKQLHWNRFIGSMIAMPFTIPFALIPIIPNIPFFYVVYRCWSHWRALKGSDHLDFILDHRLFRPISTPQLEDVYETFAPDAPDFTFVTRTQVDDGSAPEEKMILTEASHIELSKTLEVPELSGEIERAVRQVQQSLGQNVEQEERPTAPWAENENKEPSRKSEKSGKDPPA